MKEEILQYIKDNLRISIDRDDNFLVVQLYLNTDEVVFASDYISIEKLLQPQQ